MVVNATSTTTNWRTGLTTGQSVVSDSELVQRHTTTLLASARPPTAPGLWLVACADHAVIVGGAGGAGGAACWPAAPTPCGSS